MALYDNLFEPIRVGSVEIKNRIVRSPHGTGLGGESLIAYHEARARGGVGMSTIEATGVHSSAPIGLPLFSDDCMPFLEEISTRVHRHDMKLFIQLYHALFRCHLVPGQGLVAGPEEFFPLRGPEPLELKHGLLQERAASFLFLKDRPGRLRGPGLQPQAGCSQHTNQKTTTIFSA